ncbi:MAG: DUF2202 domain-containing protein [Clostridiales bacterium]|nr:DUF2202 domain-containing protein [Clostridiales bacterium]
MKKATQILMAVIMITLIGTTGISMADSIPYGAAGAAVDENLTIEEMLNYAIQDEYLAKAEYESIIKEFDTQRPYSNIIKSEETHINLLIPLFETYDFEIPFNDAATKVVLPVTLAETYVIGIEAEIANIEMYELFLEEDLPDDVKTVFERLKAASENHLKAFENASNRNTGVRGFRGRNK